MSNNKVRTLFVIDPAIKDFHILARSISEGLIPQAEVIILQPNNKEIEQITCTVEKYVQLSDIHIISQGLPGCLYLGDSSLSVDNFEQYASQLEKYCVSNIYLYGCNVGSEEIGKKLILLLNRATGANISTLFSTWGMPTEVGVGIWTTNQHTSIKSGFVSLTA